MKKWTSLLVVVAVVAATMTLCATASFGLDEQLGDTVWVDSDRDGEQDAGELAIQGAIVTLTQEIDGEGTYIARTETDSNGLYLFDISRVGTGVNQVQVVSTPDGYTWTVFGTTSTVTVDLSQATAAGTSCSGYECVYDLDSGKPVADGKATDSYPSLDYDFGYAPPAVAEKVSISGFVFNDSDADGVLDSGEPALPGPTVTLKDSAGNVVGTATAASDGSFNFTDLEAGIYTVTETNLPNYRSTNAIPGTAGSKVTVDQIIVAATTPGNSYPNQDFLDTGTTPDVELIKTGPATAQRGETITYHFKVTNTGNTWLYGGVTVTDALLGGVIWHKTPVAPGEVNEFDKTYTVPLNFSGNSGCSTSSVSSASSGDMRGMCGTWYPWTPPTCEVKLINTATAVGCPPGCGSVSDTSSCTTIIDGTECGGYTTYTQGGWGAWPCGSNPGTILKDKWCRVYRCGLAIGSCKYLYFRNSWDVTNFLPQGGCPGQLCRSYCAPTCRTSAGVFAGQVLALRLNVDFSNASVTKYGLANLRIQWGPCAGKTVRQLLDDCERVLGGRWSSYGYSVSTLNSAATSVNECFDNGTSNTGFLR